MGRAKFNGSQIAIELHDGTTNTAFKERIDSAIALFYEYRTKDFWKINREAGIILQLPDGTRIEFNHQAADNWWYATKITKNGNQILINYINGTRNILNIIDSLGRQINFTYTEIAGIPRLTAISCANDPNLYIQYQYPGSGQFPSVLNQVIYPGNEAWGYIYTEQYNSIQSVSTPYGGTINYTYNQFLRYVSQLPTTGYYQFSIHTKETSGTGIINGKWTYDYGYDLARDRDFTTITDDCGRITRYWFFGYHGTHYGTCYQYGLQDEMEIVVKDPFNNNDIRHYWEQNIWGKLDNRISDLPYSTIVCRDDNTFVPVLLNQTITTLGGNTYTTQYSSYDNFGNPGIKKEIGTSTKTTTSNYWYDEDDNIVKNKPQTVLIEGDATFPGSFAMTYDYEPNTGNPIYENTFGIETWKTYLPNGNLYTTKDGNGHITTYQWSNGAISSISNPIYTISREINWNGTVASETDGRACNECTTQFEYDNAMRLIKEIPPKGNPIINTYQFGANAFTRQTRGGFSTTTLYDGLGREIGTSDSVGNTTSTSFSSCGLKDSISSNTGDTQQYDMTAV